ncbi:MAG: ActS/PrrB/RegB family redox-sensitive histidine kinase [Pseudomonadota bacterium]
MPHTLINAQTARNALRGPVRLRTLTTIRWLAVGGQTLAIFVVHFGLGFATPIGLCVAAIAMSAWLNVFTMMRFAPQRVLTDREAGAFIAFDIVQLSALLAFTGGVLNPFSALIIAPVTIAAGFLTLRYTVLIAALALAGVSILALYHMPLPWRPDEELQLAPIYNIGVWAALSFSIIFFAAYAHRIAAESAQMRSALAATQLVLDREQRLSALGGLAAAAAHELGTPLATIQVTAKEMAHDLAESDTLREDAELLVSQAKRCQEILGRLSRHGEAGDAFHDRIGVEVLLKEAAEPFLERAGGPAVRIQTASGDGAPAPVLERRPEIIYGLRNLIENAVSFAKTETVLTAKWTAEELAIEVNDDGPGFAADIIARLGEPYLSRRSGARGQNASRAAKSASAGGLGLGFFIAKSLLEGAGAQIAHANRQWGGADSQRGASVTVRLPIADLAVDANVRNAASSA